AVQFGRVPDLTRVADRGNQVFQKAQCLIQSSVLLQSFAEQGSEVGAPEGRSDCAIGVKTLAHERDRCPGLTATSRHMGKGLQSPAVGSSIIQNRDWC